MTNAPERIWIEDEFGDGDDDQWTYGTWDVRNYRDYVVEYVRADIVQALTAERDQAWKMVAEADTRLGQALGEAIQDKADNARLREAVGILEDALQEAGDDYPGSAMQEWCQQQVRTARAALAALKGESHD